MVDTKQTNYPKFDSRNLYHDFRSWSPFFRGRGYQERRNYLYERKGTQVVGRMGKISLSAMLFGFIYGIHCLKKAHSTKDRKKAVAYEFKRKATPFLQAVEDRKYFAVQQRKEWLMQALFPNDEVRRAFTRRFNDPTVWDGDRRRAYIDYGGTHRSYKSTHKDWLDYISGIDKYRKNIPTEHY